VAGNQSVSVSLGGQSLGGTNPLVGAFVAGAVSAGSARVSLSAGPRTANGSDAYTLTAQALDANGNLNTGTAFTFSFSAPAAGASLSAATCTTATTGAAAGTCTVSLTATVAGSYAITASVSGTVLSSGNPLTAVFVAGAAQAGSATLAIDAGPKTANGSDAYTLTATARDANGNLVSNGANSFSFSVSGTGAVLSASTCTTTAGVCSVTLSATVAGTYAVTAQLNGQAVAGNNPAQAVFVAGAATAGSSRISITPDGPKAANGVDAFVITVRALDAQGNLVTGTVNTFNFSAPGTGAALSASTCSTTAGICSVQLTATAAGTYSVGASLAGSPVDGGRQVSASFQAGAVTAAVSKASISAGPKIANGIDAYTVTAEAFDALGNRVTLNPTTFTFTIEGAPNAASLSAASCVTPTTGADAGSCSVTLVATSAASYLVHVRLGGEGLADPVARSPVTAVFVAGGATPGGSRVSISSGPKAANGSDAYTLTASAYDANGNPNSSVPTTFSFSAPGAGASLSAAGCTTATTGGSAGTCSVTLKATVAGSYSVSASIGSTPVGGSTNPVTAVFVAGPATAGSSQVSISSGPKTANGSDAYTLTASAYDANGNLSTGSASVFSFSAPGAGASLSANTCSTTAGTCSVTLTATTVGSYSVTATLGGSNVGGTNPVTGVFVAGAATAGGSRVVISQGPKTANGVDAYTITASALDAQGNLNTSAATTFSFSAPGAGASLSAASCTTATSGAGAGTCSVTLKATVAGSYAVTASIGASPVGGDTNPVTGVFVAGSATAGSSIVAISTGPKLANGTDLYTITATALDAQGNVSGVTGTTFNFSAPTAGASLSAGECMTATTGPSAGTCSVTLSATVVGSYSVTATVGGSNVGGTNPVTGVFVAGAATAGSSRVTISQGPKTANGSDTYTITASALDANGNLNTSAASTFSFSAPGTGAALSAATCATATSGAGAGNCSVLLTATTAGSYSVTATVGGTQVGGTNPVVGVFVAGPVTAGSARLSLSAGPVLANGVDAYTLTASALDAQGNLNTSSAISFNFSDPGAGALLSAASCNTVLTGATAGTCSVTLKATTAGSYSVTATVGGANVGGTNPVTAVFVASGMDAGQSRVSITLTSATKMANGRDIYTITATAYDSHGNLNAWQPQTFAFSWREGGVTRSMGARLGKRSVNAKVANQWTALSAASCTTATSGAQAGSCSVTLSSTQAGWFTVLSSAGGVPVGDPAGGQAAAQFVAGPAVAANSLITISPGSKQADGVDTHTVTITARDAFDNVQADVSTLFTFSPPAAGASLSATSCSTATTGPDAGSCSVTLKASTPGTYAVTGNLGGQPAGNQVQGQFVAPAAGAVSAVPTLGEWACVGLVLCLGLLGAASGGFSRRPGQQAARPRPGRGR